MYRQRTAKEVRIRGNKRVVKTEGTGMDSDQELAQEASAASSSLLRPLLLDLDSGSNRRRALQHTHK